GRGGWTRPALSARDVGWGSGGSGEAQTLSRSRRGSGEFCGAAGQGGRGNADPRPAGQAEAAIAEVAGCLSPPTSWVPPSPRLRGEGGVRGLLRDGELPHKR